MLFLKFQIKLYLDQFKSFHKKLDGFSLDPILKILTATEDATLKFTIWFDGNEIQYKNYIKTLDSQKYQVSNMRIGKTRRTHIIQRKNLEEALFKKVLLFDLSTNLHGLADLFLRHFGEVAANAPRSTDEDTVQEYSPFIRIMDAQQKLFETSEPIKLLP